MSEQRSLLIELALAVDNVERIAELEKAVSSLHQRVTGEPVTFDVKARFVEGTQDVINTLKSTGQLTEASAEQATQAIQKMAGAYRGVEGATGDIMKHAQELGRTLREAFGGGADTVSKLGVDVEAASQRVEKLRAAIVLVKQYKEALRELHGLPQTAADAGMSYGDQNKRALELQAEIAKTAQHLSSREMASVVPRDRVQEIGEFGGAGQVKELSRLGKELSNALGPAKEELGKLSEAYQTAMSSQGSTAGNTDLLKQQLQGVTEYAEQFKTQLTDVSREAAESNAKIVALSGSLEELKERLKGKKLPETTVSAVAATAAGEVPVAPTAGVALNAAEVGKAVAVELKETFALIAEGQKALLAALKEGILVKEESARATEKLAKSENTLRQATRGATEDARIIAEGVRTKAQQHAVAAAAVQVGATATRALAAAESSATPAIDKATDSLHRHAAAAHQAAEATSKLVRTWMAVSHLTNPGRRMLSVSELPRTGAPAQPTLPLPFKQWEGREGLRSMMHLFDAVGKAASMFDMAGASMRPSTQVNIPQLYGVRGNLLNTLPPGSDFGLSQLNPPAQPSLLNAALLSAVAIPLAAQVTATVKNHLLVQRMLPPGQGASMPYSAWASGNMLRGAPEGFGGLHRLGPPPQPREQLLLPPGLPPRERGRPLDDTQLGPFNMPAGRDLSELGGSAKITSEAMNQVGQAAREAAAGADSMANATNQAAGKMWDVNKASIDELMKIPGMTRPAARRIQSEAAKREFSDLDDFRIRSGLSKAQVNNMAPHIDLPGLTAASKEGGSKAGAAAAESWTDTFKKRFRSLSTFAPSAMIIFTLFNSLRSATREALELDRIFRDIQGILPSRSDMDRMTISSAVIESSKKYAVNIREAAEAAKFFAQAGFDTPERIQMAMNASLQAVRGAGMTPQEAQELILAMDAIQRGVEVPRQPLEFLDSIARIEARRAVSARDLMQVLTKVGPIAFQLRGDMSGLVDSFDTIMAAATGIVERTRVSGTNAATSLRFIAARLGAPEIGGKLQDRFGIKLFRDETGRTLRPIAEVLHEIAIRYQRLLAAGRTSEANQLLVTLGGARQLGATTALIQSYADTEKGVLQLARTSALAFGDMGQRTDIALGSMRTMLNRLKVELVEFGDAMVQSPLMRLLVGTVTSGVGDLLERGSSAVKGFDVLTNKVRGVNPNAVRFVSQEEIRGAPQVKEFEQIAADMGISANALLSRVTELGLQAHDTVLERAKQIGIQSVPELVRAFDKGEKEMRGLREEMGAFLVQGLLPVDPELQRLQEQLDKTTDKGERHRIGIQQQTRAYDLLGRAVKIQSGVFSVNEGRLRAAGESLSGQVTHLGAVQLRISPLHPKLNTGVLNKEIATFRDMEKAFDRITPNRFLPSESGALAPLIGGAYEAAKAVGILNKAFQDFDADKSATSFGDFLDKLAQQRKNLSVQDELVYMNTFRKGVEVTLKLRTAEEESVLLESEDGYQFFKQVEQDLKTTIDNIIKDMQASGGMSADQRRRLFDVSTALESGQAARAATSALNNMHGSATKDRLLELVLEFWKATRAAEAFAQVLPSAGVAFDKVAARFEAGQSLLKGLVTFQDELTVAMIRSRQSMDSFADGMRRNLDAGMDSEDAEASSDMLSERFAEALKRKLQRPQDIYKGLQAQFEELQKSPEFLSYFGSSPEMQRVLLDVDTALSLNITGMSDEGILEVLKTARLRVSQLQEQARLYTQEQAVQLAQRERANMLLTHEVELLQSRHRVAIQQASRLDPATRLKLELDLALSLGQMEQERLHNLLEAGGISYLAAENKARELELAQARNVEEKLGLGMASQRLALEEKSAQNVQQYLSGVRGALTDMSGFMQAGGRSHFERFLGPMADLLQGNAVDRLFGQLFRFREGAEDNGIFGDFANKMGISTESEAQKQIKALEAMLNRAGDWALESNSLLEAAIKKAGEVAAASIGDEMRAAGTDAAAVIGAEMRAAASGQAPGGATRQLLPVDGEPVFKLGGPMGPDGTSAARLKGGLTDKQYAASARILSEEALAQLRAEDGPVKLRGTMGPGAPVAAKPRTSVRVEDVLLSAAQMGASLATVKAMGGGQNAAIGANIGGSIGALTGNPLGMAVGTFFGGVIGSLFDSKDKKDDQLRTLQRIDENTRQAADTLEIQRNLLDASRGMFNVPSTFTLPQYTPTRPVSVTVNAPITISGAQNSREVMETVRSELGPMIQREVKKMF
jgi:hypothetical protein